MFFSLLDDPPAPAAAASPRAARTDRSPARSRAGAARAARAPGRCAPAARPPAPGCGAPGPSECRPWPRARSVRRSGWPPARFRPRGPATRRVAHRSVGPRLDLRVELGQPPRDRLGIGQARAQHVVVCAARGRPLSGDRSRPARRSGLRAGARARRAGLGGGGPAVAAAARCRRRVRDASQGRARCQKAGAAREQQPEDVNPSQHRIPG